MIRKKFIVAVVVCLIVLIAGFIGYAELYEKKRETDLITMMDNSRVAGKLDEIESRLVLYFLYQNKDLPGSIEEVRRLDPLFLGNYDLSIFLYAYSPDKKKYHLGVKLTKNATPLKRKDKNTNFNSKLAGYINGFDGSDPVYDLNN